MANFALSSDVQKLKGFQLQGADGNPPDSRTKGSAPDPVGGSIPDLHCGLALPRSRWAPTLILLPTQLLKNNRSLNRSVAYAGFSVGFVRGGGKWRGPKSRRSTPGMLRSWREIFLMRHSRHSALYKLL